jgi:hypothetical protein
MTKDEALKMCLEYIETNAHERKYVRHAIKESLAQPEPVAWEQFYPDMGKPKLAHLPPPECKTEAEKTAYAFGWFKSMEAQRTWVGLTKKEFEEAVYRLEDLEDCWVAIEAKLRSKNT